MSTKFLNGKEIKGNEKIKEGDCIVCIDNIEGTVYKFQSGKSWLGVDNTFKDKVIKAMCELYCDYKKREKTWKILEISSAYRTEREQAEAMVDYILVKSRDELVKTYKGATRRNPLNLISSLYYDGNHLICRQEKFTACVEPCVHGSVIFCKADYQHNLLEKVSSKEKAIFMTYNHVLHTNRFIDLKKNTAQIKDMMEAWIKASGFKSYHQLGLALDFSSKTPSGQREEFKNILLRENIFLSGYSSGNFHIKK